MNNYALDERFRSTMFTSPGSFDFDALTIQRPDNLPAEVDIKLAQYNDAIQRFDIEGAEQAADDILEWLHCMGTAMPT